MNPTLHQLVKSISKVILERKETVAAAESVTGGLVQHSISTADNAIQFYQGGITTYNLAQKYKHLDVEPIHAQQTNCVSDKVVRQMGEGVCNMFSSDWGLAISGYASAVPEADGKIFALYAIVYKGETLKTGCLNASSENAPENQLHFTIELLRAWEEVIGKN